MTSASSAIATPNDLEAYWMPFTANRSFKKNPRMVARAEGMFYYTPDNKPVMDGTAGLWCCNAGHCRPKIVEAIRIAGAPGVDVSSGVESARGVKDPALIRAFIAAAKGR